VGLNVQTPVAIINTANTSNIAATAYYDPAQCDPSVQDCSPIPLSKEINWVSPPNATAPDCQTDGTCGGSNYREVGL